MVWTTRTHIAVPRLRLKSCDFSYDDGTGSNHSLERIPHDMPRDGEITEAAEPKLCLIGGPLNGHRHRLRRRNCGRRRDDRSRRGRIGHGRRCSRYRCCRIGRACGDRNGGHRSRRNWLQRSRRRRSQARAFNLVQRYLIFAGPCAHYFRAHVVEQIGIVLNCLGALIGGRPRMGNTLAKPFDLGRTTHKGRGEDRGGNRSAVIGNAFHSDSFRQRRDRGVCWRAEMGRGL